MFPIIDSHQHFWSLSDPWQAWPTRAEMPIYKNFHPDDLRPLLRECGIGLTVIVQSSESISDTLALLAMADEFDFVGAVVGWVDFEDPLRAVMQLEELSKSKKFRGVRPMLQGQKNINWLQLPSFQPVFDKLIDSGFTFDALIGSHQLVGFRKFAAIYPDLKIVIDHAAKPQIGQPAWKKWREDIAHFEITENVSCKLSGLLTEAPSGSGATELKPTFDVLVSTFGFDRLMWGSDWPVLNLANNYPAWLEITKSLLSECTDAQAASVFCHNTAAFYKIKSAIVV